MNSFFFVAVICAVAFAAVDVELTLNKVTVLEVPKGKTSLSLGCAAPSGSDWAVIRVSACFGDLKLYGDSSEITDPETAEKKFEFSATAPANAFGFSGKAYAVVTAESVSSGFYDGATGVFEAICVNDPNYPSKIPQGKTGITSSTDLNGHKARVSFPLNNDQGYHYQVYTRSFNKAGFNPKTDNPPTHFFGTACSAALWMNRDTEAEKVAFTSKTGTVTVTGISKTNTTVVNIVYGVDANSPHVQLTSIALNGSGMAVPIVFLSLVVLLFTVFF